MIVTASLLMIVLFGFLILLGPETITDKIIITFIILAMTVLMMMSLTIFENIL